MLAALAVAAAATAVGAPSGCKAHTVTIRFDPRGTVTVTGDGKQLARATAVDRKIAPACNKPVSVSPPQTPKAIARRVTVTCTVRKPVEIEAHPIVPSGSQLIVAERGSDTWLATAVLKPGGSRVYVFSAKCRVA